MTGEQAKQILLDLCFRHPQLISEDYCRGHQKDRLDEEIAQFIYEAIADGEEMQAEADRGYMDGQIED